MGFNMLFYIIFGTNLLTGGPVPVSVFLPILEFRRKGIPNGVQTEQNFHDDFSWTRRQPGDLECKSEERRGGHKGGGRAPRPCGPLDDPLTQIFLLYILKYPKNYQGSHETTFPLPQPSVPVRSHLGAFSRDLSEGDSIMEGFYINSIALPMKRGQFTTDLRVHSQQLDGLFSLFNLQYKVLLDVLGDLFDVILFAVCLLRSDEFWFMIKIIYEQYLILL